VVCLPFIDDFPIQTSMPGKPRFMTPEGNGFMDTQLGLPENGPQHFSWFKTSFSPLALLNFGG